jgi:hypothetical protein
MSIKPFEYEYIDRSMDRRERESTEIGTERETDVFTP